MWYDWISDRIGLNQLLSNIGILKDNMLPEGVAVIELLLCAVCGYLLGSINPSIIVSKKLYGKDIRELGSGNAGLTNMLRIYGKKAALLTLFGDTLKSALAIFLGAWLCGWEGSKEVLGVYGNSGEGAYLGGLFCVIGHIAPVYYKFKGGKGVLAAATMILLLDPYVFICLVVVFALVVLITRFVSLGSVIAAFLYPALTYITHTYVCHYPPMIFKFLFCFICGFMVIFMHRENMKRIYNGKENRLTFKKKKLEDDEDDIE